MAAGDPKSILFAMTPEWGSLIPTLPLARRLTRLGFEVAYLGPSQGWADDLCARLAGFLAGRGFAYLRPLPTPGPTGLADLLRPGQFLDGTIATLATFMTERNIGLVVGDSNTPMSGLVPLAAKSRNIPMVSLETNLISSANRNFPPFTSRQLPRGDRFDRPRVLSAWASCFLRRTGRLLVNRRESKAGIAQALLALRARRLGLSLRYTELGWRFGSRQRFVLCPREFDFSIAPPGTYLGGEVDIQRTETPELTFSETENSPLFYCSLGTHSEYYPHSRKFFATLIEVFRRRPNYRAVIHVGGAVSSDELRPLPSGVRVLRWVNQPQVLQRASAAVTHGGLGTIKECVHFGVPMLVFPMDFDQPGNSARVVWHGLGERGDPANADPEAIGRMLDRVLERREHHAQQLARMRKYFCSSAPLEAGAEMLARIARGDGAPSAASGPPESGFHSRRKIAVSFCTGADSHNAVAALEAPSEP